MVVDKEILRDIQTATIVRNTCLESDHELSIFDMKDQWLHIHPREEIEEEKRHRCTPKNWTKEQREEYTELTSKMEKCGDIGEEEDISKAWTRWAEQIEIKNKRGTVCLWTMSGLSAESSTFFLWNSFSFRSARHAHHSLPHM